MPSSDKVMPHDQMHWLKTLIFTHLRFIKAVASDQHNYANNIKMIKGVHQLTLRPNMHLHQRRFRRIYLSTNPSPHDPQNLLLAQTNRPMKTPGRIFSIFPSCQSD